MRSLYERKFRCWAGEECNGELYGAFLDLLSLRTISLPNRLPPPSTHLSTKSFVPVQEEENRAWHQE